MAARTGGERDEGRVRERGHHARHGRPPAVDHRLRCMRAGRPAPTGARSHRLRVRGGTGHLRAPRPLDGARAGLRLGRRSGHGVRRDREPRARDRPLRGRRRHRSPAAIRRFGLADRGRRGQRRAEVVPRRRVRGLAPHRPGRAREARGPHGRRHRRRPSRARRCAGGRGDGGGRDTAGGVRRSRLVLRRVRPPSAADGAAGGARHLGRRAQRGARRDVRGRRAPGPGRTSPRRTPLPPSARLHDGSRSHSGWVPGARSSWVPGCTTSRAPCRSSTPRSGSPPRSC
jgi:hypothetical protein